MIINELLAHPKYKFNFGPSAFQVSLVTKIFYLRPSQ